MSRIHTLTTIKNDDEDRMKTLLTKFKIKLEGEMLLNKELKNENNAYDEVIEMLVNQMKNKDKEIDNLSRRNKDYMRMEKANNERHTVNTNKSLDTFENYLKNLDSKEYQSYLEDKVTQCSSKYVAKLKNKYKIL